MITPLLLLSGVFFPLDRMPGFIQLGAEFLPLTHAVGLVRPLMTGVSPEQPLWDLLVLVIYTVAA